MPPFSLFVSEFAILSEAFSQSRVVVGGIILVVLSIVFGGFAYHLSRIISGQPQAVPPRPHFTGAESVVMAIAAAGLLYLGLNIPRPLATLLHEAVKVLQ
jgi:hydrogenase-4 component F